MTERLFTFRLASKTRIYGTFAGLSEADARTRAERLHDYVGVALAKPRVCACLEKSAHWVRQACWLVCDSERCAGIIHD